VALATFDAVVLAGGRPDAVSKNFPAAPNKAFVPIEGVTLVARTIAALRSSSRIGRIVAVAPLLATSAVALSKADEIRLDGPTMSASLRSGLAGFPPDDLVLVSASDLPILTRAAVEDFLARAEAAEADVVYACVERRIHEARFPGVPHTWARLGEGTFCGGGCVALRPRALPALDRFLGRLGKARKNPLRLASIFGYDILLRYATRRLTIAEAEHRASELLGLRVAAAACRYPEIAINVDRASDVELAQNLVRELQPALRSNAR
jgi:molybdopterin-guanine dinucleotide biosynthesis protein A